MAKNISKCIVFKSVKQATHFRERQSLTIEEMPDNRLFICHPHIADDAPKGWNEDNALDAALRYDIPDDATDITILDHSKLPTDYSNRNSWDIKNGKIIS